MTRMKVLMFCAALASCPAWAQDADPELEVDRTRVVPPSLQVRGEPNGAYAAELEARVRSLDPTERKAFFKHLRKQQRELGRRIEEMIFNYEKSKALKRDISGEGGGISTRAGDLVEFQRKCILQFKEIHHQIDIVRKREDPQRVDALDFQADFYAGLQFSNLYSEGDKNSLIVKAEMAQIETTIRIEMDASKQTYLDLFRTSGMRRRALLGMMLGFFTQWSGNTLIS